MKVDKETAESLRQSTELRHMVESDGWKVAKAMLVERIALLDSVSTIPSDLSFEEIGKEALFRARAISLVQDWLNSIEGRLEQADQQQETLVDLQSTQIVRTYR
jgi:hypothetical protein